MRVTTLLSAGAAVACAWMLSSCGAQPAGNPQFIQAFGDFDSPCTAQTTAAATAQHCVARVVLTNEGGEGYGHVTLSINLKGAQGSADLPATLCGASVPDTPPGGHAQLVCTFDVPPGQTLPSYPIVKSIDFVGASSRTGSVAGGTQTASLILTAATAALALAALILVATVRRRPPASEPEAPAPAAAVAEEPALPAGRSSADAEYELPQLPR